MRLLLLYFFGAPWILTTQGLIPEEGMRAARTLKSLWPYPGQLKAWQTSTNFTTVHGLRRPISAGFPMYQLDQLIWGEGRRFTDGPKGKGIFPSFYGR